MLWIRRTYLIFETYVNVSMSNIYQCKSKSILVFKTIFHEEQTQSHEKLHTKIISCSCSIETSKKCFVKMLLWNVRVLQGIQQLQGKVNFLWKIWYDIKYYMKNIY